MEEFKYWGTTWKKYKFYQEEIKSRLKSWNACYHSAENLLSSNFLSKKLKIKIYVTIILCLRIRCWGEYFGLRRTKQEWSRENYIMRSLMICTLQSIFFVWSNREEGNGRGMKHLWGRGEVYTGIWWGNSRERDHLEDPCIDGRIILRWILQGVGCGGMDWIDVAQDRNRCRALVSVVLNPRVP